MKITEEERMELAIQQNIMFEKMANEVKDRQQVQKAMEQNHMIVEAETVGKDDFEDF